MSTTLSSFAVILVAAALYILTRYVGPAFRKYRGARVITCPETGKAAGVRVDAGHAAITSIAGKPELRLSDCSRWPEKRGCGQECLKEISASPENCLVRTMLTQWYAGKLCVLCAKPLGIIDWTEHKPALMSPERLTVECADVPPEKLQQVLATHKALCWNCHISETFRREHPEMVIDRPWQSNVSTRIH